MRPFDDHETISAPTSEIAPSALRRDAVVALRLHQSGDELDLPGADRITIGAGSGCDLPLDDGYASKLHCTLERRGARLYVRDQRSTNGTFLNGNRVELAELTPGNLLTVGKSLLVALGCDNRSRKSAFERLRGRDPAFRAAVARTIRAAASSASILILGETGTGKELVARAIHDASPRAGRPFVAVNCGAIPGELIEAELFGHERGAFTGAERERDGVFVQAHGGTLFLDELGELPLGQQPHLLRALEERRIRRVGGATERAVDIRLVSATNRLAVAAENSPVRTDLYHRVATIVVELPPLRARKGDLAELVASFQAELAPEFGPRTVAPATLAALAGYDWPGNVRELRQAVHRATALSSVELRVDDLMPSGVVVAIEPERAVALATGRPAAAGLVREAASPVDSLDRAEPTTWAPLAGREVDDPESPWAGIQRGVLAEAWQRHGSIREAARSLGIPKSTFADRAQRLGLRAADRPRREPARRSAPRR